MDLFSLLAKLPSHFQGIVGLTLLLVIAFAVGEAVAFVSGRIASRARARLASGLLLTLLHERVIRRAARILPPLIVKIGLNAIPELHPGVVIVIGNLAVAITVLQVVRTLLAVLDALLGVHQEPFSGRSSRTGSIKSYIQLAKIAVIMLGTIAAIAALIDRSPLLLLSGLGAMSAVLMLVFKDTILSFTAGVQLASNDMLRVGDWIEMPQLSADGAVIDIALHTVKVQNWDKTITTIPTWRLMSESYRNWRGMSESGGRRIKRTLRIDAGTIRFLEDADLQRLRRIELLRPYLDSKLEQVTLANTEACARLGELGHLPANQRRLTNIGTFRAYVVAYLNAHPQIHHEGMALMVRQLEPTADGVPIELYCFTRTVVWAQYEGIQSDIFDHLLAILPEFDLRIYQHPSSGDLRVGLGLRAAA